MGGGGDFGSGSGSKFNCAARVGSGWVKRSRVRAGFGLQFWARADLYEHNMQLVSDSIENTLHSYNNG